MGAPDVATAAAAFSTMAQDNNNDGKVSGGYEGITNIAKDDVAATASNTNTTTLSAYLSLVQQYLSVFMIDNAIFLIERCLAEYPYSLDAIYLQALCYYRIGNPKRCRSVLERIQHSNKQQHSVSNNHDNNNNTKSSETTTTTTTASLASRKVKTTTTTAAAATTTTTTTTTRKMKSSNVATTTGQVAMDGASVADEKNTNNNNISSMLYLAAQCSYELGEYSRAEEALLKDARMEFYRQQQQQNNNGYAASMSSMDEWILQTTPCPIPNGAAGLSLLGQICRRTSRKDQAICYLKMSLKLDPFLWTSFATLAELNAPDVDPSIIFGVPSAAATAARVVLSSTHAATASESAARSHHKKSVKTPLQPMETPASIGQHQQHLPPSATRGNYGGRTTTAANLSTPGLTPIPVNASSRSFIMPDDSTSTTPPPPNHASKKKRNNNMSTGKSAVASRGGPTAASGTSDPVVVRRAYQVATRQYYPPSPETPPPPPPSSSTHQRHSSLASVTRSMRYLRGLGNNIATTNDSGQPYKRQYKSHIGDRNIDGSLSLDNDRSSFFTSENHPSLQGVPAAKKELSFNEHDEDIVLKPEGTTGTEKESANTARKVRGILELLCIAGTAYQHLCAYQCREALAVLTQALPRRQQVTAGFLHMRGRAHQELNDFTSAQRCLEEMQAQDPGRMQGLELLSTVYWQQKKEVELAHLAQRVVDWDRLCPEAWCVVGNCFSLQKDHESALLFFQRSLQLDQDFTYSHTLSGYEYMANDDFDKATSCFRNSLRIDDRHYNAWYGLGAIYYRQEKYDLAEYHFARAVAIHPTSSILRCNLGIAQYANGKAIQALETLQEAFRLDPRNPQARFQRATIFSAMQRHDEALVELERVRDAAPREAAVHFAMGKVLKKLGHPEQAMRSFLTAMDLDPKDNQLIKAAMDKLDEPDVDEESMAPF